MNDQSLIEPGAAKSASLLPSLENVRIGIVGLGYVGLPLAVYLARSFPVTGFDVNNSRVAELGAGKDRTGEVTDEEFAAAKTLSFSADPKALESLQFLYRHRADPDRSGEAAGPHRADARERDGRQDAPSRRRGRV